MTKDDIIKHLEDDSEVTVFPWTFYGLSMRCHDVRDDGSPCCEDDYKDLNEAADKVIWYANGDFSKIELIE